MRVLCEGSLFRLMGNCELAYVTFGLSGLQAEIEFPSDWHEESRVWVRLGFGLFKIAFSFPWKWVVPDNYQCSGPTYGFHFFADLLFIRWGKDQGMRNDPHVAFTMPWGWRHREHKVLTEPETHPYTYILKSGEVQDRLATIQVETRLWTRPWIPTRLFKRSIDVEFNAEVGERTGSWKGGVLGCGYEMLPNETPLQTLRRMEIERQF
jgi:hypothetical protein